MSYEHSERGTLKIYRNQENFDKAVKKLSSIFPDNCDFSILGNKELIQLEPQLKDIKTKLSGGIHFSNDEIGDAYKFCKQLEDIIRSNGGRILTNTKINKILVDKRQINCVVTDRAILQTKRVVVCAGSWSRELLKKSALNYLLHQLKVIP